MNNYSKQRDCILNIPKKLKPPPTEEEIYNQVKCAGSILFLL